MKIAIIGRGEFLYNSLKLLLKNNFNIGLIITSKEAPEYKIKSSDFEQLANEYKIPFYNNSKINQDFIRTTFQVNGFCDIGISVNYVNIIDEEVIKLFPFGILNAHGGDLPRYRGNACQAWAIINGEKRVGLCVHKMIGGKLDSGDIITRDYYTLNDETVIGDVFNWFASKIPLLFLEAINKLQENSFYILEAQSLKAEDALRCYPRNPDDAKINMNESNVQINRLIRASSEPFAGAWCIFKDEKLIIWRAQVINDSEIYLAINGQVSKINEDGTVEFITGKGKLRLIEIEYNSNRTKHPSEIIKSTRDRLT